MTTKATFKNVGVDGRPAPPKQPDSADFSKGVEFVPVFIFSLMLMTSFINQDVKGMFWMLFVIVGLFLVVIVIKTFKEDSIDSDFKNNTMLPLFATFYNTCSTSSFLISFTFMYLFLPMIYVSNINYSVIFIFLFFYFYDVLGRKYIMSDGDEPHPNFNGIGTFVGTISGITYGVFAVWLLSYAGDRFMYFTPTASNKEYCSRPKNQQFKCNVYKNGEIISTL